MRLEREEITALAAALAGPVADILEARLSQRPEWAFSHVRTGLARAKKLIEGLKGSHLFLGLFAACDPCHPCL